MITLRTRNIVILCLLSFLLSLGLRVYGLRGNVPQADELHWQKRSGVLLEKLRTRDVHNFSTHMTHPGLVPGFLMATGQLLAEKYNALRGYSGSEPKAINRLHASRLACAAVASLIVPLLFYFSYKVLGIETAFLAACLLALDPHHLGLSRQAHLDAVLSFLVVFSVFSYWRASEEESLAWKLFSGVLWGLCIATKPTAVALPLIFLLFNAFRSALAPQEKKAAVKILSFSDVGAVALAHAVFALLYSRLWVHESEYKLRLAVKSAFADQVYSWGVYLAERPVLSGSIMAVLVFSVIATRWLRSRYQSFLRAALLSVSLLFAAVCLIPQVLENLIRFWTWVAGLSGEKHKAYGITWDAPEHGYLLLFFSELPSLVCLSALAGICLYLYKLWSEKLDSPRMRFLGISLLTIVCWTVLLSVSAKQTLRYVLPVVPMLYLFSAFGLARAIEYATEKLGSSVLLFKKTAFSLIIVFHFFALLSWWPNFNHFYNVLSGGLPAAVATNSGLAIAGATEALEYLQQQQTFGRNEKVWVALAADKEVFSYQNRVLFPKNNRVRFLNREDAASDYLLLSPQFAPRLPEEPIQQVAKAEPSFVYRFKDAQLLSIHPAPLRSFAAEEAPYFRRAHHIRRATGKTSRKTPEIELSVSGHAFPLARTVMAIPGQHRAGFVLLGEHARMLPGDYLLDFYLRLPPDTELAADLSAERYVLRMEFGRCHQIVKLGELNQTAFSPSTVGCDFQEPVRAQLRAYWFGNVPVEIAGIGIRAKDSLPPVND